MCPSPTKNDFLNGLIFGKISIFMGEIKDFLEMNFIMRERKGFRKSVNVPKTQIIF